MIDIISRLLIAAGLLAGTTYLPTLSEAVSVRSSGNGPSAAPIRTCPARLPARALACVA